MKLSTSTYIFLVYDQNVQIKQATKYRIDIANTEAENKTWGGVPQFSTRVFSEKKFEPGDTTTSNQFNKQTNQASNQL